MKFHTTLSSLLKNGLKQKTTWVGITCLIFYIIYFDDISFFIHNLAHSDRTLDAFLTWLSNLTVVGLFAFLTAFKNFNNDK